MNSVAPLLVATLLIVPLLTADARPGQGRGRGAGSYNVDRETQRGGSIDASGSSVGRFGQSSVDIDGADGGSYDADRQRAGRFGSSSVDAEGPKGGSVSASGASVAPYRPVVPYRSGYVYTGGTYRAASISVNTLYVAPVGIYAGWNVFVKPTYVDYPAFATLPVEVAVQAELEDRGYYNGPIDGDVGPVTEASVSQYQSANDLAVTGTINQALLVSLGISEPS
jgi:N-acetylmuramoyl-L-alanine amidase